MVALLTQPKKRTVKKVLPYHSVKLIPEGKIFGGKTYLARRIFQHAPVGYDGYCDCYGGMGSMTYNHPVMEPFRQVYVEKNWFRWNLKYVIKNFPSALQRHLRTFKYDEATFQSWRAAHEQHKAEIKANKKINVRNQMNAALAYLVTNRMSRLGQGDAFGWSDRLRGGQPGDLNAWMTMVERIPALGARLQPVTLINGKAMEAYTDLTTPSEQTEIGMPEVKKWWFYCDPTYLKGTRVGAADEYGDDEMTFEEHAELALTALQSDHFFTISAYRSDTYDKWFRGWRRVEIPIKCHASMKKAKDDRLECLYMNY